jgi:MFS family permease
MTKLIGLLRRLPAFRLLWSSELVSLLGDWLSYVAVSLVAMRAGQGAIALAWVFAAHVLPAALLSPLAGVVADRFDRRRVLVGAQLAEAAVTVAMAAAAAGGLVTLLQTLLFARSALGAVMQPARQAALKRLVPADDLVDANALDASTWSVMFALGTALGGVVAMAGPVLALSLDAATFVAAAAILWRLPPLPAAAPVARDRGSRAEIGAALRDRQLFEAVFAKAPLAAATGAGWVVLNLRAAEMAVGAAAALTLGLLHAARGIGTGVGPLAARRLLGRGTGELALLRPIAWLTFATVPALAFAPPTLAPLAALVWGMGSGCGWVLTAIVVQRRAPDAVVGRLTALDQLAFTFTVAASALAAAFLVDLTGSSIAAAFWGVAAATTLQLVLTAARRTPAATMEPELTADG